jgi:hypothetical protein
MSYLYAAYIATWAIHLTYLAFLVRGIARLRAEARELDRAQADGERRP